MTKNKKVLINLQVGRPFSPIFYWDQKKKFLFRQIRCNFFFKYCILRKLDLMKDTLQKADIGAQRASILSFQFLVTEELHLLQEIRSLEGRGPLIAFSSRVSLKMPNFQNHLTGQKKKNRRVVHGINYLGNFFTFQGLDSSSAV